jgi:hypothetical protein
MKYLKKFEAKKSRTEPIINTEEILKNYQYHIEDMDEKSPITFEEFFNGLDFNIFSKNRNYHESGLSVPKKTPNITIGDTTIYSYSYEYGPYAPIGLDKSIDWCKRNIFLFAEVNTGGASGGSCYDEGPDDGARHYDGDSLILYDFIYYYLQPILEDIISTQATTKTSKELCDILHKKSDIIHEDSRCNNEYYGNYDDYSCYYITLEDLFKFLYENEGF